MDWISVVASLPVEDLGFSGYGSIWIAGRYTRVLYDVERLPLDATWIFPRKRPQIYEGRGIGLIASK